ncbi:hypothetical protein BIU88_07345 [Chlorobaculum limnaeum]|uniref:DUF4062 domain-containing protein n=1 Tax=Chlorobaculum limnaeum TaxID=274537 RepID=A0A1D8CYG8_CHLLM|nr:tetratricopeptide repeat protein [Chlorobaculum limnaeum]AOS83976.1 hypothetical protein BIU88_07345 [Chlorobaculum limnaeum]
MSATEKRKIRAFIASPNDLAEERRVFRNAIDVLNIGFGDGANVEFVALGWEDTLASTGRRSQGVINQDIDSCDVFILAMHRRWGQDAPDAGIYTSYTEEEFHRALERWKKTGAPEIFVFFKRVDAASEADAGPQLSKVIKFRQHLEETRQILYRYFDSPESFFDEVDTHLRAYAKGDLPKAEDRDDTVVLPIAALQEVERVKKLVLQKTEEAKQAKDAAEVARLKTEEAQLEMAEVAAQLAMEGKVEFAREKFTKLVTETTDIKILSLGSQFFYRTGDLDNMLIVLEKWLSLSGSENQNEETLGALIHLGLLYQIRGELERAEEIYEKSLAISEELDDNEGMANVYGNLGIVYEIKGDLDRAENAYQKSLRIHEALGCNESIANQYGNLGNVYLNRGKLERAEEMYQKSMNIYSAFGNKEGIAMVCDSLGNLYRIRGELKRAKDMSTKALVMNKSLGRKVGIANSYGNIANVYLLQGELETAEAMYKKSLAIDEVIGNKEFISRNYSNLANLYKIRGEHDRAVEMYEKSIVLYRAIGSPKEKHVKELLEKLQGGDTSSENEPKK